MIKTDPHHSGSGVIVIEGEEKLDSVSKLSLADGLLDLVIGCDDVDHRQDAEVDGQVQEGKEPVQEQVLRPIL